TMPLERLLQFGGQLRGKVRRFPSLELLAEVVQHSSGHDGSALSIAGAADFGDVLEELIAAHVQAPSSASNECSGRSSVPRATSPVHASGGISFGFLRHCLDDIVLALEAPVRQRIDCLKRLGGGRAFGRVIDELGRRSGKFQSLQGVLCAEFDTCGHQCSSSICGPCSGWRDERCGGYGSSPKTCRRCSARNSA